MEQRERLFGQAEKMIKGNQHVLDLHWEAFMKFARKIDKPGIHEFPISDLHGKSHIKALRVELSTAKGRQSLKQIQREGPQYALTINILFTKEWPLAKFDRDTLPMGKGNLETVLNQITTDQFYFHANELAHKSVELYFNGLFPYGNPQIDG